MANTIRLKRTSVAGRVPTTADLSLGEVGLNTFDGKLYMHVNNGVASIKEIGAVDAMLALYRPILQANGSHIAGRVAGVYGIPTGNPLAITGIGTLYPVAIVRIDAADFPPIDGKAAKLRIRATLETNDVAPTGTHTVGLHPITRPATSGGSGVIINTIGAAVAGSTVAFVTPAADSLLVQTGTDFALPANGFYCLGVVTTTTVANSSLVQIQAQLQAHNV